MKPLDVIVASDTLTAPYSSPPDLWCQHCIFWLIFLYEWRISEYDPGSTWFALSIGSSEWRKIRTDWIPRLRGVWKLDVIKVERVILALGGGAKLRMLFCKAMEVDQERGDTLYLYTIIQIKSGGTKSKFVWWFRTKRNASNRFGAIQCFIQHLPKRLLLPDRGGGWLAGKCLGKKSLLGICINTKTRLM